MLQILSFYTEPTKLQSFNSYIEASLYSMQWERVLHLCLNSIIRVQSLHFNQNLITLKLLDFLDSILSLCWIFPPITNEQTFLGKWQVIGYIGAKFDRKLLTQLKNCILPRPFLLSWCLYFENLYCVHKPLDKILLFPEKHQLYSFGEENNIKFILSGNIQFNDLKISLYSLRHMGLTFNVELHVL